MLVSNITVFLSNSSQKNTQILGRKYPNKAFFVPNVGIFVSSQDFAIRQIRRFWFQIWQRFFKILAQKYANKAFFSPKFRHFYFITKFWYWTNSRMLISNMTTLFWTKLCNQQHKFKNPDFKYDNIFFKFQEENTQIQNFLWKLKSFFFSSEALSECNFV